MNNLKPSVCIDAVFEGESYFDACNMVKSAGISAIEFWGWWNRDLDQLQVAQKAKAKNTQGRENSSFYLPIKQKQE